jgi:CCR4-NOT transcription complex subunit 7/8
MTGLAFFKMKELFFEDSIDEGKYSGHLYGLGHAAFPAGGGFGYENDPVNVVENESP